MQIQVLLKELGDYKFKVGAPAKLGDKNGFARWFNNMEWSDKTCFLFIDDNNKISISPKTPLWINHEGITPIKTFDEWNNFKNLTLAYD